ncbi:MAG: hypothetical protein ACFCD0_08510 [Gemmataceae bacterium]
MAALSTIRSDHRLSQSYHLLRSTGKCAKVAITAVARKLLTHLNAMVRDGQRWWQDSCGQLAWAKNVSFDYEHVAQPESFSPQAGRRTLSTKAPIHSKRE